MSEAPTNLAMERMHRSGDCREWKPLDALKELIRDIEDGTINPDMLYICMREVKEDSAYFPFVVAGVTEIECLGLLYKHLVDSETGQRNV